MLGKAKRHQARIHSNIILSEKPILQDVIVFWMFIMVTELSYYCILFPHSL
jgi:hypothetical protein